MTLELTCFLRPRCLSTLALAALSPAFVACSDYQDPVPPTPGVVTQATPPPAISGGTLIVTQSGLAVASDPDRDRVWIVDLDQQALKAEIVLEEGSEPGRVVEDASGHAHVALRAGGAVAMIDPAAGKLLGTRAVCPAPRGLAYDKDSDALYVACAGGELVTMPAGGGAETRRLHLADDLRDVVVNAGQLFVSRFRAAEVLALDADGSVLRRRSPPDFQPIGDSTQNFVPAVAWRMVALPSGGVAVAHQREMTTPIIITAPAYYSAAGCDPSIVHSTVSLMGNAASDLLSAPPAGATLPFAALPVDIAVSRDGAQVAIVAAGSDKVFLSAISNVEQEQGNGDCSSMPEVGVQGQPIAAAFHGGNLVVQTREPPALVLPGTTGNAVTIRLPGDSKWDAGHNMFHRSPNLTFPTSVACASCHPEGRDDGHTWNFDPTGLRRTQSIGGGVLETAPLHWDGDLADMDAMMGEVFQRRMGGQPQGPRQVLAFARWIDALPVIPPSASGDADSVARGEALFHDKNVACATCHSGERLTNDENKDVGTGKAFQVPSLVGVAHRGPYMHNGCAATLHDRFDPACGGGDKHGHTSQLTPEQIDDLVAYLEQL